MARDSRDVPASARRVVAAVAIQLVPLLGLLAAFTLAAAGWWAASGDAIPAQMFARLTVVAVVGLLGSFVVHELAHLGALRRIRSVESVRLERTAWRLSLHAQGRMTPRQIAAVAVAGPGACTLVGLALAVLAPGSTLPWWYLAHLVALVPPLGDGRALVLAMRAARRPHPTTTRRT
ncbi:MAG: hypothetical protein P1U38_08605 [Aeromicrobium sp.]|uniref:hypothetical protein n=1 Tax=Aeromicrobium sp. TaxID=1871063 RepID=UPI00260F3B7B|nr:hypothetical protein [Aeromicrobium sp.]MDF1704822.1 hypothetical protein [Aeromicrobium sp.]